MLNNWIGRGQSNGDIPAKNGARRPVIGLALGGGAARGFAHIGIVKTLIAHGIVPNVVVGTSIGAVVGGSFAAGRLDTLEEWARSLQPRSVISYLDLKLNGSGLIGGEKLAAELETSIGQTLIEDLPLKFAICRNRSAHRPRNLADPRPLSGRDARLLCAAGHLCAGADRRPLAGRRRAGQPGAGIDRAGARCGNRDRREPLERRLYPLDDNLFARRLGRGEPNRLRKPAPPKRGFGKFFSAERAVKREFFGGAGRPGISSVMVDAFNIMQDRITRARLAGDPPDLLITPRVGQIGWFDFHRADELIDHGARAAERAIVSIQEVVDVLAPTPVTAKAVIDETS